MSSESNDVAQAPRSLNDRASTTRPLDSSAGIDVVSTASI
jgi:hypothetical protein